MVYAAMPSPGNDGWGPSRIVPPLTSKQVPSTAALETHLKVMAIHEELPDFGKLLLEHSLRRPC